MAVGAKLGLTEGDLAPPPSGRTPGRTCFYVGDRSGNQMVLGPETREARAARNELMFRAVNEQIVQLTERFRAQLREIDIICECADVSCTGAIRINLEEYEAIDRATNAFVVIAGHEDADIEAVIAQTDGYFVVRKHGLAGDIVEDRRDGH